MSTYGPYSPVCQADNLYFVSGQIGVEPVSKLASKSIEEQTRQAIKNLQAVLATVELGLSSVVKTTIFLKDIKDYKIVNDLYMNSFPEPRPARSCVEVSALPKIGDHVLLIEIEAIATKGSKS